MRRLLAAGCVLAAMLAAALWFAPRLIDEAVLRARLAAIASERLARPVTLAGPITLQLLPEPRLEAADIAIGAPDDNLAATARGLRLTLDAAALLRGRIEPRELVIVGAELRLPWPPAALLELRPPPWLAAFEARLEDSRVTIGALELEALAIRLSSSGANAALLGDGRFTLRGRPVRFSGHLGRAGLDGAAPLDANLSAAGGEISVTGILGAAGEFEGDLAAAGSDLAAFLPAPPGPFEARGRLVADAELVAIDPLNVSLGRQTLRGAASLRLDAAPRLDLALTAGRIDLDAWIAALRQGGWPALPVSLDLSAEAAKLGGLAVRRLRAGVQFTADRLAITDAMMTLPGDTLVEAAGASAGPRLELAVRVATGALRPLLEAVGLQLPADPARLRRGEARFRLALDGADASFSELDGSIDDMRITGSGAYRAAPRPTLGLGLTVDRLTLEGLLPTPLGLPREALAGIDLNLRLAADRASWLGVGVERATLDAGLDAGRLAVRRLGFRLGELDVTAGGVAELAPALRLADLTIEANGASGPALAGLLPAALRPFLPPAGQPVLLRASGAGSVEAVAVKLEAELEALRLEAAGTLDLTAARATGTATLRHPGAARLLAPLLGGDAGDWLGDGSLAVISVLAATPSGVAMEHLDLVAGTLRGRGRVALGLDGPRPLLTGRFAAERLQLPAPPAADTPIGFDGLRRFDADLALEAEQVAIGGRPVLEAGAATLRLADGALAIELTRGRLGGGALAGAATLAPDESASGGSLAVRATLADATLTAPLAGLPFDLAAGRVGGSLAVAGQGASAAALLATLAGEASIQARDGVLAGLDLRAALAAAARPALPAAEAGLRDAFAAGATAFERLAATATVTDGRATLAGTVGLAEAPGATFAGTVDVSRSVLDLRFALRPAEAGPEVALRASGPWAAPRRLPELAPYLRWRAEQG